MCHKIYTLSRNKEGCLQHCHACNMYSLQFNNLYLELTPKELRSLQKYVLEIDVDFWEACPKRSCLKRKIPIPTLQHNLILTFSQKELESLKDLIFENALAAKRFNKAADIDYNHQLNWSFSALQSSECLIRGCKPYSLYRCFLPFNLLKGITFCTLSKKHVKIEFYLGPAVPYLPVQS